MNIWPFTWWERHKRQEEEREERKRLEQKEREERRQADNALTRELQKIAIELLTRDCLRDGRDVIERVAYSKWINLYRYENGGCREIALLDGRGLPLVEVRHYPDGRVVRLVEEEVEVGRI